MSVIHVDLSNFDTEVLKSNIPVIVDFYADWCGPCRMLGPILENLAVSNNGKVKVVKVNVDNSPDLAIRYGVQAIPTVVFIKDGNIVGEPLVGVKPISEYQSVIDSLSSSGQTDTKNTTTNNIFEVSGISDFQTKISNTKKLVIVDFYADWCGPCRILKPSLEKIAKDMPNDVVLLKVNVDSPSNQMLAADYGVSGIPHVVFIKSGIVIDQFVGAYPYEAVLQKVKSNI